MRLTTVPLTLREANRLVDDWHRHHVASRGHRFSIGVIDETGQIHGAVIVGRPVARAADYRAIAEVARLVTDGTPNACSMLYAAAARACKAMGFEKVWTYILDTEPGTSLKAAGWVFEDLTATRDRSWAEERGPAPVRVEGQPTQPKARWSLTLNPPRPAVTQEITNGNP